MEQVPMVDLPMNGRCICGKSRYQITEQPQTLYACHCTDCQTASGAGFVLGLRVPSAGVKVVSGNPTPFPRTRENGSTKSIFRCPECLTALWGDHQIPREYVTVYAGTLDGSSALVPVGHIWTRSAQPWISIPDTALKFEQQPPNMEIFIRAWKERVVECA